MPYQDSWRRRFPLCTILSVRVPQIRDLAQGKAASSGVLPKSVGLLFPPHSKTERLAPRNGREPAPKSRVS